MPKQALNPTDFPFYDYRGYAFSLGVQAAGNVWLAGHTASRYDRAGDRMVVTGSLAEQAVTSHAKQMAILVAAGMDFRNVVRVVDYVTPAGLDAYAELIEERQRLYGAAPPAVSTVVVKSLLRPAALIETEIVATHEAVRRIGTGVGSSGAPAARAVQAGDLLYCSALLPSDAGRVVDGGLVVQAAQIYEQAEDILYQSGYSMAEVIKTTEWVRSSALADYRETGKIRARFLGAPGTVTCAATGIPMRQLAHPDALIQIEFIACRGDREILNPGWSRYDGLTYASGVRCGAYVCLSGQLSVNPLTNEIVCAGDIVGQARYIYGTISETLAAGGLGIDSVVKTVEYVAPAALKEYRATAEVRREFFPEPYPAATGVICDALLRPEALIEVDCWAYAG